MRRRLAVRSPIIALAALPLLGVCAAAGTAGTATADVPVARSAGPSATGVDLTYTKQTVLVDPATVAQQLLSISADGSTFTFRSKSGPLAALAPGKVMFLQGKAVADVTGVSSSGGHFVVKTSPPALTDFIQSGTLDVDAPVTFAGGGIAPEPEPPAVVTLSAMRRAGSAGTMRSAALAPSFDVGAAPATSPRPAQGENATNYSGTTGGIDYAASISRATDRLDFTVNYKDDKDGLIAAISTTGYIDTFAAHLQMVVVNDLTKSSSFLVQPLDGHLHMDWSLARGPDAKMTLKVPAFTLPFAFNFPFIVGGVPFFVKVQFQLLVTIALTAKNSTMQGGVDLDYDGSGGGLSAGKTAFMPEGTEKVSGNFLTPPSVTPIASGAVIAVDAPKLIFGIGLPVGLSGYGYIDLISSLGETTGSLIAGQSCERDDLDFTVKAGVGAEFIKAIPEALLPHKDIYNKTANYSQPGCGT